MPHAQAAPLARSLRTLLVTLLLIGTGAAQALSCSALRRLTVLHCAGQHQACSTEFQVLEQADRGCRRLLTLLPVEPAQAAFTARFAARAGLQGEPGLYVLSISQGYWEPMEPTTQAFMEQLRVSLELQSSEVTPDALLDKLERVDGLDWRPVFRSAAPRLHRLNLEPTQQGLAALRQEIEDRARAARRAVWVEDGLSAAGALPALLLWVHGTAGFFRRLHREELHIGRTLLAQAAAAGLAWAILYAAPFSLAGVLMPLLLTGMVAALAPQLWALLRQRWRPAGPMV
ncbi:hypothetical protein [Inhella proteolytica]|uniref:Uncharacterized protein n=1 Tax=Inhella proteolytica TaxID=2795029 RepID=A0A931J478_9BURK|nr:hypothetical protein [Inhella proteolytica]MBH9577229.1 hypothetical protein [Inhella proteolytica]